MIDLGFDKRAFTEVYIVLKQLRKNQFNKIPKDLINVIEFNKDNDYDVNYENIERGILLPDSEKILATIYSNYLSTTEEKIVLNRLINFTSKRNFK